MTRNRPTANPRHRHAARQAGLTLIELMISMAIGLVLLAAITSLIVAQSSNRNELEKSSRQIENGRYASQVLRNDIQLAGFYGQLISAGTVPTYLPNPCLTTPAMASPGTDSLLNDIPVAIQGYDSPATSPITTCLPNADFVPNTDILVIRHADTQTAAPTDPINLYLQTSAGSSVLAVDSPTATGSSTATFPLYLNDLKTVVAPLRKYHVYIYFLSPCDVPAGSGADCTGQQDDNGHPIPTLKRLELTYNGGVTQWIMVPLVEGIENMQFDYGMDTNGDGYPDSYITNPLTSTDWSNVMAVRINLLARIMDCTTGYRDTKVYNLGIASGISPSAASAVNCGNGDYKRHVFTELVRAINPSGRRAAQ